MFRPKYLVFFVIAFISLLNSKLISQDSNPITSEPGISVDHLTFIDKDNATQIPFTGDLNFSIPILTIPGRNGLDFPIFLNYNGRIRSKQKATSVGLGFNLQIGSITRKVVKRADDQQSSMFYTNQENFNLGRYPGYEPDFFDEHSGILYGQTTNDEWDDFNLLLPNNALKLKPIYDDNGVVEFQPETRDPWRVNHQIDRFISSFIATNEDGISYQFNHVSNLKLDHPTGFDCFIKFEFPVSWELTEVFSADYVDLGAQGCDDSDLGSWIKLEYDDYAVGSNGLNYKNEHTLAMGEQKSYGGIYTTNACYSEDGIHLNDNRYCDLLYDYSHVDKISTPTHYAEFVTSSRDDYPSLSGNPKKLDKIILKKKGTDDIIKIIEFNYAQNENDTSSNNWSNNEKLKDDCLTLINIQEIGGNYEVSKPPLRFEYNSNPTAPDPYSLLNLEYYSGISAPWTLDKIITPEGGTVSYTFEHDEYNWFFNFFDNSITGDTVYYNDDFTSTAGHRIATISYDDGINSTSTYAMDYGEGVLHNPQFSSERDYQFGSISNKYNGVVGYRWVKVNLPSNNGSVINYYTSGVSSDPVLYQSSDPPPETPVISEKFPDDKIIDSLYSIPVVWHWVDNSAKRGKLWKQENKNQTGNTIQKTEYDYEYEEYFGDSFYQDQNGDKVPSKVVWSKLESTKNTLDDVDSYIYYDYNTNLPNNYMPYKISQINSNGDEKIDIIKYAYEEFPLMENNNMLSQVFSKVTYLDDESIASNAYQATKTEWIDSGSIGAHRFFPTSTHQWLEEGATKNYSGDDDSEYILVSERNFDDFGNVISNTDSRGTITKLLYGHNGSKIIGKVTNSSTEDIIFDNFNDNSVTDSDPFTWTKSAGWSVNNGKLISSSTSPYYARIQDHQYQSFNADVQLQIEYASLTTYWAAIHFGTTSTNYTDGYLAFYRKNGDVILYKGGTYIANVSTGILPDKIRRFSVQVDGNNIKILLEGKVIVDTTVTTAINSGYISLYSYKTQSVFDNFRVYPIDALAEGYAYDPITLNLNENTDANNLSKYNEYDKLGRLSSAHDLVDGEKTIVEEYEYYLSRDHNGDTFDEDDPNYTEITLHSDQLNTSKIAFYTDGFNKTIQEQSLLGNSIIVNKSLEYNNLNQIYKSYKPYTLSGSTPSYDSDDSTHSDNYYNNQLGDYGDYTATNGRPFYETGYHDDPLQRKEYEAPEGTAWWNNGKLKYFGNSGNDADVIPLVTGFPTPYYSENTLYKSGYTDEQGLTVLSYSDKFGNLIAKREDPSFLDLMTLFSYDILGNLIKTTDPNGLVSTYSYNTINKLTEKTTPDAGSSKYLYDQNNNLRFNRNAEHNNTATHNYYYSNYLYGSTTQTGSFSTVKPAVVNIYVKTYNLVAGLNEIITLKLKNTSTSQVTLFEITAEDNGSAYIFKKIRLPKGSFNWEVITSGQSGSKFYFYVNSRYNIQFEYNKYDKFNRVTENGENYYYYSYSDKFTQSNANNYTFPSTSLLLNSKFNYDFASDDAILVEQQRNLRGKVSSALSYDMNDLAFSSFYSYNEQGNVEWVVNKWVSGKNNKVKYKYDLQGKITQIDFLGDHSSYNYYKFFEYDDIGKLANVYTADNSSGTNKTKEAEYEYYADGSVKRMELGADGNKAQGVDYLYNTRGWLSQINHQNLNSNDDPGGDGANGIPLDKFGMVIGYNNIAHIGSSQSAVAQWSGNISWLMYKMFGVTSGGSLVGNTYTYDNVNRLKLSDYGYYSGNWLTTNNYDVRNINYDDNGNITGIQRYWNNGLLFDNQTFVFNTSTNRLNKISDNASSSISSTDIDNQNSNNYVYDENGNVVQDVQRGIGFILYDVHNLPTKMYYTNGDVVEYIYDVNGNRVTKKVEDDNILWNYAYGANGNVEARIKENSYPPTHVKHNLWGNDLVGIREYISYYTTTDEKYYYLKDHLGSIKVRVDENGAVVGYDDYYPFGMVMNGRSGSTGTEEGYKYTGKERDVETGLDYFGARYYDSKIGRWLSVDPLAHLRPGLSPYNYVQNNPLNRWDPTGMLDEGEEDESIWSRISRFLGFSGNSSHSENPGTEITESVVSGVNESINNGVENLKKLPQDAVDLSIKVSDAASDAYAGSALFGLGVTGVGLLSGNPFLMGLGAEITASSITFGSVADVTSFGAKLIDATAFNGSTDALESQALKTAITIGGGKFMRYSTGRIVTRTSSKVVGPAWRGRTGFVSNRYGYSVKAASDATSVAIGLGL